MSDIARWLDDLGLKKYAQVFADNEIDFEVLSDLTEDDLTDLGIPLGPRKKLYKAIVLLRDMDFEHTTQTDAVAEDGAQYFIDRAERRHLTMMFCDIVGSTPLAERLDPEDFREIIRNYQDVCNDVIGRYEGYVARYVGDGLLAYFGFPRAHEDEAERAVRSALGILTAVGEIDTTQDRPLQVRIGISTGLVVVGDIVGQTASQGQVAVGGAPNIAARLQTLAEPDSVLIAEPTRVLLGDQFDYQDLGTQELKGVSLPVRVWQVLGERPVQSRFDATHGDKLTTLIGRGPELELLLERWQRAVAKERQMILLAGEAGIGKSRVVEALQERLAGEEHAHVLFQCSPYHVHSPLYPAISYLEFAADLNAAHSLEEKAERLTALLETWSIDDKDVPWFKALLSLPVDPPLESTPEEQKRNTLGALSRTFEKRAGESPLLWVMEDAHWMDPTTRELIDLVSNSSTRMGCLTLVTYRPEFTAPWHTGGHCTMLTLNRLGRTASMELIADLIGGKEIPTEISDQIIAKTDGIPLFVEELTKAVLESRLLTKETDRYVLKGPLPTLAIPSTLQDSLMARLDRLKGAKEIGQVASVIGREFTYSLLETVSPVKGENLQRSLDRLTRSGIVQRYSEPPQISYVFKHSLVQDAAYESLLRKERQALHQRIADAQEQRFLDHGEGAPEILAHHYTRAGLAEKAVIYWLLASQRAFNQSANLEVVGYVANALELIDDVDDPESRKQLELNLQVLQGAAYRATKGFASSQAETSFSRARDLCYELGDTSRLIDVLRGLYSCHYARGELSRAGDLGEQVLQLGNQKRDSSSRMLGHWMLGCINFWQGAFDDARDHLEQASSLYEPSEQRIKTLALQIDPGVNALLHLGWTLWILGYPDQALRASDKAIATARELSQPFALSMALFFACETRACAGYQPGTAALLEELQTISKKFGLEYMTSCASVLEGQALIANDDNAAGLQCIQRAFSEFQGQEAGLGLPWAMSIAATAYKQLGKYQEGMATVSKAFSVVEKNGERHWEAELHRLNGELLSTGPEKDVAEAQKCFLRAVKLAREQGAKSLELRAAISLAGLGESESLGEDASQPLVDVCAWFDQTNSGVAPGQASKYLQSAGAG